MTTSITAKFMWKECRPDNREFRQNSSVLEPLNFTFGVEIPISAEYIVNIEEILATTGDRLQAELGFDDKKSELPTPIYTPKALQFCLDKLGEYLRDPEPKDFQAETSDDWGDTNIASGALTDDWAGDSKSATEDDGWSDAIDTDDKHKDDEKWTAESEDWS